MTVQPLWGSGSRQEHNFFDVVSLAGFPYQSLSGWGDAHFIKPEETAAKLSEQRERETRLFAVPTKTDHAGIAVKYNNPAKGFVSLAICNSRGQIVRTLLAKAEREAGKQTEIWDGLDDEGKPAPPGEYQLKALTHPGIKPRFVVSLMNSGNPPWGYTLPRHGWGADHGLPIAAASDPDGNTYLLWTISEAGSTLISVDATGQKQWGTSIGWGDPGMVFTAMTYDDGLLYVTKDGAHHPLGTADDDSRANPVRSVLMVFEAKTGRRVNLPTNKNIAVVCEWPKKLLQGFAEPGTPSVKMKGGRYNPSEAGYGVNLTGVAVSPDRVFCSLYLKNEIVALDKKTLQVRETYPVLKPSGLVFSAQHHVLYAISGDQVVVRCTDFSRNKPVANPGGEKIPTKVGTPNGFRSFIASGLALPCGLALDGKGNLYVSVRGEQMQVLVFDLAGKLVRRIGKTGGRPWIGKYDPTGMLMPAGLSVDAKNRLWVMEYDHSPKRISLWNCANGKLIKEFFGAAAYAPGIYAAEDKPEEVIIHNTRHIVDYEKGAARVDATLWRSRYEDNAMPGLDTPTHAGFSVTTLDGKRFGYDGYMVYDYKGDRFQPLFVMANGSANSKDWFMPNPDHRIGYVWSDANGDGKTQSNEVREVNVNLARGANCQFGVAVMPGLVDVRAGCNDLQKKLFVPKGLTASGVPNYPRPEDAEWLFRSTGEMAQYDNVAAMWPAPTSKLERWYAIANSRGLTTGDGIYKFDRDGRIHWRYNRVKLHFGLGAPLARPGDMFGALTIVGVAAFPKNVGEVIGIGVYRGYFSFLNEDGLFIDQIGYDIGRGPTPNFDTYFIENFQGQFLRHPRTGKAYLLAGDVDGRILELQGWDKIRRFDAGKLVVTEAVFQQAASGEGRDKLITVSAGNEPNQLTRVPLDETRAAEVGLSYDAENLYAVCQVPDPTPWHNGAKDWHYLFKGGDAVDIQLGPLDAAKGKRKPQTGDVRVMIAPGEKPDTFTVAAMWLHVPTGMAKEPYTYQSPTGQEGFQRVARLSGVTCKLERDANGYRLQATIPWKELGLAAPKSGTFLQGDVGVLQSDGSGTQTSSRRYFYNPDTAIVNDVPTEVRVNTSEWGKLYFQ
jgi:hypothetical protein